MYKKLRALLGVVSMASYKALFNPVLSNICSYSGEQIFVTNVHMPHAKRNCDLKKIKIKFYFLFQIFFCRKSPLDVYFYTKK